MSAAGPPQSANSAPAGGSAAAKPQAWGGHASGAPPLEGARLLVRRVEAPANRAASGEVIEGARLLVRRVEPPANRAASGEVIR